MRPSPANLLVLALTLAAGPARADDDIAAQARAVLTAHCERCHGTRGPAKGGFNFILERDKLVARHKVVPGEPDESELYQKVHDGEMPPKGKYPRPSERDRAVLRRWIEAGAPAGADPVHAALSPADVLHLVLADLQTIPARQRRFARYFTLHHLAGAGVPEDVRETYRQALAKLVNSLSWHPRVTRPQPLDAGRTVFRIDLRDYQWNARLWDRVLSFYPYRVPDNNAEAKACAAATGTELPLLRGDWFVATASRPPLYHDLLQLPTGARELERQLRVEVLQDIDDETSLRAGFNDSGVSKNNRLIERHDAAHGAYWRSYDFSDNLDRQNLFDHPLGPNPGRNSFVHAGGEVIFNLPNGLQAYLLVDGNGRRVDRAPVQIVSDPRRPDRIVENGLSCMACHARGIIPKADQVRAHVENNPHAFSAEDVASVRALYVPEAKLRPLMDDDSKRFLAALARTGVPDGDTDPVSAATLRYEATLDLPVAAAEAGLPADEFAKRLRAAGTLSRLFGPLLAGGTVQRDAFLTAFPDLVRELRLGSNAGALASPPALGAGQPFAGHTGYVLAIAVSPDGRRALSAGEDRTVRLWDVPSGRELRCLEGHTDEVLAVAFAPDGRRALSGGADRKLRLWDVDSARELACLEGHTDKITSVAFSPDGRRALSGSWDQTLRLWDLEKATELGRMSGHAGWITAVAFAPDGRQVLSAGYDRTLRLWDVASGRELRRFEGHAREVYHTAFSPDGRRVVSGGNDRTVRLWDVDSGKELRRLDGHANAVIRVAFSPDGRRVLSGSSRYQQADESLRVWDADSGRALRTFRGPADAVWSWAFAPDGSWALTGGSEKTLRLWKFPP